MKINVFCWFLLACLTFASCESNDVLDTNMDDIITENVDIDSENERGSSDDKEEYDDKRCFDFVYPISYTMPDGSTVSGDDEKSVESAVKAWYDANSENDQKPALEYPVEVVFKEREPITINTEEQLKRLYLACEGEQDEVDDKRCFDFVYPISYTMPDGSTVSGDDEKSVESAVKAWYDANPENDQKPALVYPVEVIFEDRDASLTVNNQEELRRVYASCEDNDDSQEERCFVFEYPISYTMPDGSTITGDSKEEIEGLMERWYVANPEAEGRPMLQYPVTVILKDRTVITLNSKEEMEDLKERCEG